MGVEIERKFLLRDDSWRVDADAGVRMRQGYLTSSEHCSIRVRIRDDDAFLGIKSATSPIRRLEFEFAIPVTEAETLLGELCVDSPVEKTRYHIRHGQHLWEIDVFEGANAGLIVAEIELTHEDEAFDKPAWLGDEVSHDARYFNMNLARRPYSRWA
jgi:adenylate cyclase